MLHSGANSEWGTQHNYRQRSSHLEGDLSHVDELGHLAERLRCVLWADHDLEVKGQGVHGHSLPAGVVLEDGGQEACRDRDRGESGSVISGH